MQTVPFNQTVGFVPPDVSSVSGKIFDGIKFIRLSQWKECTRSTVLLGGIACAGQIFRRFELKKDEQVVLEFWFRGTPMSDDGARKFAELLKLDIGDITAEQLTDVSEVWRASVGEHLLGGVQCGASQASAETIFKFEAAEVGELNGRRMLALWWKHNGFDRKFLSMFIDAEDGPGKVVHEIHFSAPIKDMHRYASAIVDTLRSFQWTRALPPPIVSTSSRMSA